MYLILYVPALSIVQSVCGGWLKGSELKTRGNGDKGITNDTCMEPASVNYSVIPTRFASEEGPYNING